MAPSGLGKGTAHISVFRIGLSRSSPQPRSGLPQNGHVGSDAQLRCDVEQLVWRGEALVALLITVDLWAQEYTMPLRSAILTLNTSNIMGSTLRPRFNHKSYELNHNKTVFWCDKPKYLVKVCICKGPSDRRAHTEMQAISVLFCCGTKDDQATLALPRLL